MSLATHEVININMAERILAQFNNDFNRFVSTFDITGLGRLWIPNYHGKVLHMSMSKPIFPTHQRMFKSFHHKSQNLTTHRKFVSTTKPGWKNFHL